MTPTESRLTTNEYQTSLSKDSFLLPEEIRFTRNPTIYHTILGSCVSICICHRETNMAAMNHYVMPIARQETKDSKIGRYGNVSVLHIIQTLFKIDPNPNAYLAYIYGGANMGIKDTPEKSVGRANVAVARAMLHRYQISITKEETGGTQGRRLTFDTRKKIVISQFI